MNSPFLEQRWYVLVDDLVGGYAIANVDKKRVSALDWRQSEITIGEFFSEELATYVVKMHNLRLDIRDARRLQGG
jgi:hypothetical protein